jgi:hypothetical protein
MNEKYYFNGPNAKGTLRISKSIKIEHGDKIPESTEKSKIADWLKRGLITTEKNQTCIAVEKPENIFMIEKLKKEIEDLQKEKEILDIKFSEMEKTINLIKTENKRLIEKELLIEKCNTQGGKK